MTRTLEALSVGDLMTGEVRSLRPGDTLAALHDLMEEAHCRHVPVVDEQGLLVGLVTHRDLLRHAVIEQPDVPRYVESEVLRRVRVGEVMNAEVESVEADADLRLAAQAMFENKYGCLPVVDGRRLVGILTESDFVRWFARG